MAPWWTRGSCWRRSGGAGMRACLTAWSRPYGRYARRWLSRDGLKRCIGVGTGSRPRADRTEVDRLLHELRSTLARLKAELDLLAAEDQQEKRNVLDSVDDALRVLDSLELAERVTTPPLVLVIDDDQRLASITARQLARLGFSTQVLENLSAVPAATEVGTRAVVDLGVLRLAGEDERDQLRLLRPIVVSGSTDPIARIEAESYGASDYLTKPVDLDDLRTSLIGPVGL